MNWTSRLFPSFLSLFLILAAPGLAPYEAAAQIMRISRVIVPAGEFRAPGAAIIDGPGGYQSFLPSSSLQTGPIPGLTPTAELTPVPSAPSDLITLPKNGISPLHAIDVLRGGKAALTDAAKNTSADAPRIALNGLFEGETARPEAPAVSLRPATSNAPHLDPSQSDGPTKGPREVKPPNDPNTEPSTSIKRTFAVGFLAAVTMFATSMAIKVGALLSGYQLHPNYMGPLDINPMSTVLPSLALWIGTAILAPIAEEAVFRGGIQKFLRKISTQLQLGSFVAPALTVAVLFASVHENADPVMFVSTLIKGLILSYVYHKEGILASMAAHGLLNGMIALLILLPAAYAPFLAIVAVPLALYSAKLIREQKPAIASGALSPAPLGGRLSILLAAILLIGYFTFKPGIFLPIGAAALIINGLMKLKSKS